ncbi:MAG: C/D box methylation guide ribonucleoprotein complex aNOP56 subunit [Candidatus Altiarchaeota archaeon]
MAIELITNAFGVFALKNGRVIEKILFPKNASFVALKLVEVENSVCEEEKELVLLLKKSGVKELSVDNPGRFRKLNLGIEFKKKEKLSAPDAEQLSIQEDEFMNFLREVQIEIAKIKLKESSWDRILIQSINTLQDLENNNNIMAEHLREWYSLNFPELEKFLKDQKSYAIAIAKENELDKGLREKISAEKAKSFGMKFSTHDIEIVKKFAEYVLAGEKTKEDIDAYITYLMEKNAPNITALVGALLGAKLISLAGSLEKLALMPSSTIQILGAEKAFFKFLKTRKKPPKHGIIFQLPEIRSANRKIRGKISRTLAAKLSIAAKADYYKGDFVGDKLREDFLRRIESLKNMESK